MVALFSLSLMEACFSPSPSDLPFSVITANLGHIVRVQCLFLVRRTPAMGRVLMAQYQGHQEAWAGMRAASFRLQFVGRMN